MSELIYELPFPPTVNTYWRSVVIQGKVRVMLSKKGRAYSALAYQVILTTDQARLGWPLSDRMQVTIELHCPDKRRRDVDNYVKAILDSLTKAGVWWDDEQVDLLTIARMGNRSPGCAVVKIQPIGVQSPHEHTD